MSNMIMELINLIRKGRNGRTETQWLKELNYFKLEFQGPTGPKF